MAKLFGTDGVRGLANVELTPELSFKLGRAFAHVLTKEKNRIPTILIGRDTRVSGTMLEAALTAGICSVSAYVKLAGVIPTPGVAYLVRKYGCDAGIVVSASHNPFADNGIKFFNEFGYKLKDELEEEIEEIVLGDKCDLLPRPSGLLVGSSQVLDYAMDDYMEFLKQTLTKQCNPTQGNTTEPFLANNNQNLPFSGLRIALDCANGATSFVAPALFFELGAFVCAMATEPDGFNINAKCGSTHMESLVDFVKENKCDIGIAFDGDGDRCLVVDECGNIVDGDQILSICGNALKDDNKLKNNTIVATVMSNLGFMQMGKRLGIHIEKTKVGDRYVLENMLENGSILGGEQSGHIIFLEHNTTGDGILTALFLVSIIKKSGKTLSCLNTYMEKLPQVLVNAKVLESRKREYLFEPHIKECVAKLEQEFGSDGRVLIRPSGTEPLIRVMIEGKDIKKMQQAAEELAALMEKMLS